MMDERVFELQADVCKVFSHPKRLHILCLLKTEEKTFSELQEATGLSKANLSQHLSVLRERGVIDARRQGQNLYVSVANPKITAACELMHDFLCDQTAARQEITGTSGG